MSKHCKHSAVITLLDDLPLARDSYQATQSLAVLYTQLEILARDRSDHFQMQKERSKRKNKPVRTTNASLRRKGGIEGLKRGDHAGAKVNHIYFWEITLSYHMP